MISDRISKDITPQMKVLNKVISILMHFCSFVSNQAVAKPAYLEKKFIDAYPKSSKAEICTKNI